MNILVCDFESFFSNEYTLSKMTTEEYVRDPRFEIIGVGVKMNDGKPEWFSGTHEETREFLISRGFEQSAVLFHNAAFDAAIASWVLGLKPKFILDTLSMARPIHGAVMSLSLAKLSEYYGIGTKGNDTVWGRGLRRADFTPEQLMEYAGYCALRENSDVNLTYRLFQKLLPFTSKRELKLIDATIRMFTEPRLVLDRAMLEGHLAQVRAKKDELLAAIGGDPAEVKKTLMSNPRFAELLESHGVTPPTKISPTTGKEAFAFAKTDQAMTELLEHENPEVQALVAARLGVKTTIEETRTERLIGIAGRGRLPISLNYCGAVTTHRWSGGSGEKLNAQNWPRGGAIRKAVTAPPGMAVVVGDSANIELRVNHTLAGQSESIEAFKTNRDLYCEFATALYGRPITKADYSERFLGKLCLGEDTLVLTRRGWVPIVSVLFTDKLWDGESWVSHAGVKSVGRKETVTAYGITATADHRILTGRGWREWHEVLTNRTLFQSALSSVSLPSSGMSYTTPRKAKTGGIGRYVGALAEARRRTMQEISGAAGALGAMLVGSWPQLQSGGGDISGLWTTMSTGVGYLPDLLLPSLDARARKTLHTRTTGAAGLPCVRSGYRTVLRFYGMCRRFPDGMIRNLIWTGLTRMRGMSQTISGSLAAPRTARIGAKFPSYSENSTASRKRTVDYEKTTNVYDILSSGPKNCFTILSDRGPIIAHNCHLSLGYGCGPKKFREICRQKGVDLTEERAKEVVGLWREVYSKVSACWRQQDTALRAMHERSRADVGVGNVVWTWSEEGVCGFEYSSGHRIRYHNLTNDEDGWSYHTNRGRKRLWGGTCDENNCQSLSRHIIAEQWLAFQVWCEQNYPQWRVVLQVHDELVAVGPEDEAPAVAAGLERILSTAPSWWPDLCLGAETGYAQRYGMAKS